MVLNITELKDAIEAVIMKRLDHKNLDKDVEYFAKIVSNYGILTTCSFANVSSFLAAKYDRESGSLYLGQYTHTSEEAGAVVWGENLRDTKEYNHLPWTLSNEWSLQSNQ